MKMSQLARLRRGTRRPKLQVVRPRRVRRYPFYIAASLLIGSLVVAVAATQAMVSQTSFRVEDLSRRTAELQQEHGRLKLEVAELSAPGRIASEARLLGLKLPDPDEVTILYVDWPADPRGSGTSSSPFGTNTATEEQG